MNAPHPADDKNEPTDLSDRITAALRSREPSASWVDSAAARLADGLPVSAEERPGSVPAAVAPLRARGGRVALTGVATSVLVVGVGVGVAAANPFSGFAAGVEQAASAVGLEWSFMPEGYTREQYNAFWGAGYSGQDMNKLQEIWHLDVTQAKARAGQMLLDGEPLPIEPGAYDVDPLDAPDLAPIMEALDAGYTDADIHALEEIWHTDYLETKAHVGELLLAGKPVPVEPSGTPVTAGE